MSNRYRERERISLLSDVPEEGLARGEAGTVVHVFGQGDACLVEFVDPHDGSTRALVELPADRICASC